MDKGRQKNISFAEFELDLEHRRLLRNGSQLALHAKTFDLLAFLVERNCQIVSKDEILESVWPDQFVEEANLSVQISTLRKALGENRSAPRFLLTIPGRGYKFVADIEDGNGEIIIEKHQFSTLIVEEEIDGENGSVGEEKGLSGSSRNLPRRSSAPIGAINHWQKLNFAGIAGLFVLAVLGFWFFSRDQENHNSAFPIREAEKTPKIKRLTTNGRVSLAVLSPDGKFFAYSYSETGRVGTELRLGQTNGSSDVALFSNPGAVYQPSAFSSDGSWLYFTESQPRRFTGTLYKIPILGGLPQKILDEVSIYSAISPDEKQIALVRNDKTQKKSALILANLDGTGELELLARPIGESIHHLSLSWSGDGTLIAFGAATGGEDKTYEVFVVKTADGTVSQLTNLNWKEIARLDWLPDGNGLLAVAQDKDSVAATQIWQIDYPEGKARKITSDLSGYGSALSLSQDSNSLIAVQWNKESNIWVAPSENLADARQITFGSLGRQDGWYGMDWMPDGRIVYVARVDQSLTLWMMDSNGARTRQITPPGFQDQKPSVSIDGQFIVFESNRKGVIDIWRVESDGSNLRQLTAGGENTNPSLTPDGKWLVYQHNEKGENSIWRLPAHGGGEPVRITNDESTAPRVSPDGKFVACGYFSEGKPRLAVVPIEGGEPVRLFDLPQTYNFDMAAIRWSPDGRFLHYRDWINGIWRQSVAGGEPERLENLPAEKFYTYGWSPDGRQFAFTRGREARDIVLITDFK